MQNFSFRTVIRLGEHNLRTEIDCIQSRRSKSKCINSVKDFTPSRIIIHPQFNTNVFTNDIAMIRLSNQVQFNGKFFFYFLF